MSPFAAPDAPATPIRLLTPETAERAAAGRPPEAQRQLSAQPVTGRLGEVRLIFGADGALTEVLAGWGTPAERARQTFPLGGLPGQLPAGAYAFDDSLPAEARANAALGWLLQGYRFDRYAQKAAQAAMLHPPHGIDAARVAREALGAMLTMDLVNTPANDMGPDALEAEARKLAEAHGAGVSVIRGDDLLTRNLPLIHAVGRAAEQAPRLIDMGWGDAEAPRVTLVGKGVCFDTGGLNLKSGGSMGLMKKDMGGAAAVLGLAHMIMDHGLAVRLRVLIPAVENSVSAGAFRPVDVLTARNGRTIEVNNTDAEGRLVLADALALADEKAPELMISMATLTGAARVALGPDLPAMFTDDDRLAADLHAAGGRVADPLWRLPFWDPYEEMIEPEIADLDNAPKGGMAGAITAALFVRRFVAEARAFAHIDCYG